MRPNSLPSSQTRLISTIMLFRKVCLYIMVILKPVKGKNILWRSVQRSSDRKIRSDGQSLDRWSSHPHSISYLPCSRRIRPGVKQSEAATEINYQCGAEGVVTLRARVLKQLLMNIHGVAAPINLGRMKYFSNNRKIIRFVHNGGD